MASMQDPTKSGKEGGTSRLGYGRGRSLVAEKETAALKTPQNVYSIPPGYAAASHEEYVQKYILKMGSPAPRGKRRDTEIADSLCQRLVVETPDDATRRPGAFPRGREFGSAHRSASTYISSSLSSSHPTTNTVPSPTLNTQRPDPVIVAFAVRSAMAAPSGPPGAFSGKFQTGQQASTFAEARSFERRPALKKGEVILPEGARGIWAKLMYDAMITFNHEVDLLSVRDWANANAPQDYLEAMAVSIIHQTIALYELGPRVWLAFPFDATANTKSYEQDLGLADRLGCIKKILLRHKDYLSNILSGVGYQPMIHAPHLKLAQLDQQAKLRREKVEAAYRQRQVQIQPQAQVTGQELIGLQALKTNTSTTQPGSVPFPMPVPSQQGIGNLFPAGAGLASIPDPRPHQPPQKSPTVGWNSAIAPHHSSPLDPHVQYAGIGTPRFGAAFPPPPPTSPRQGHNLGNSVRRSKIQNQPSYVNTVGRALQTVSPVAPPGHRRPGNTYQPLRQPPTSQTPVAANSAVPHAHSKTGMAAQQQGNNLGGSPNQSTSASPSLTIYNSTEAIMNRYGLGKSPSQVVTAARPPGMLFDMALQSTSGHDSNIKAPPPPGAPSVESRSMSSSEQSAQSLDNFDSFPAQGTPLSRSAKKTDKRGRDGDSTLQSLQDLSPSSKRARLAAEQDGAAGSAAAPEDSQDLETMGTEADQPAGVEHQPPTPQVGDDFDPTLWGSWMNGESFGTGPGQDRQ